MNRFGSQAETRGPSEAQDLRERAQIGAEPLHLLAGKHRLDLPRGNSSQHQLLDSVQPFAHLAVAE